MKDLVSFASSLFLFINPTKLYLSETSFYYLGATFTIVFAFLTYTWIYAFVERTRFNQAAAIISFLPAFLVWFTLSIPIYSGRSTHFFMTLWFISRYLEGFAMLFQSADIHQKSKTIDEIAINLFVICNGIFILILLSIFLFGGADRSWYDWFLVILYALFVIYASYCIIGLFTMYSNPLGLLMILTGFYIGQLIPSSFIQDEISRVIEKDFFSQGTLIMLGAYYIIPLAIFVLLFRLITRLIVYVR